MLAEMVDDRDNLGVLGNFVRISYFEQGCYVEFGEYLVPPKIKPVKVVAKRRISGGITFLLAVASRNFSGFCKGIYHKMFPFSLLQHFPLYHELFFRFWKLWYDCKKRVGSN